jgi:rhamnulokinase
MEEVFDLVPRSRIYQNTGLQFLPFNTLYQLMALKKCNSPALQSAVHFLTIPDLLNYWLTGKKVCEFSIATTTQCYDPIKNDWARELLLELGIPVHIFPEIVPACSLLGDLLPYIAEETGAFGLKVIAPACHDTGSAVLSVPAEESGVAFLSSGTWSLIGMEVDKPIITDQSLAMNFTNEGCVGGHFRFLKNITGLWIVQECRRYWATHGEEINYTDLTSMAEEAAPSIAFIDTDYQEFLKPGDMPIKVQKFCRETGQKVPETKGEIVRIILESLALKYKEEFTNIEQMAGNRIETMHIVGGGTQNLLLNQFTANALNRKVITGPVEATAIGNILGQLMALGVLSSTDEAREVVRNSFDTQVYTPSNISGWEASYERYLSIRKFE